MQARPTNPEINTDIFMRMLGMPDQALLLVGLVLILAIVTGGFLRGFPCGLAFYFLLRRFLKDDPASLDWLIVTARQKRAYGPRGCK